jgi:hypothetical protein
MSREKLGQEKIGVNARFTSVLRNSKDIGISANKRIYRWSIS